MKADELVSILRNASDAYYNDIPIMSDEEYDALHDELESIDPENGFLSEVGSPAHLNLYHHKIPMGSLDNVKNENEFIKWWNKVDPTSVIVQYKYDGASVGLEYQNGKLITAASRGDGIIGEDITINMKNCWNHQNNNHDINTLDKPFTGSVRGEAIIYKNDWSANFTGESNPRNSTVGAMRKEKSQMVKWVRMSCYDIIHEDMEFTKESDKLAYMDELGLPVSEYWVMNNPQEVIDFYERTQVNRSNLNFMIDGLVVKVNNTHIQEKLGSHNGRPKWAVAFKFPCLKGDSKITGIILSLGHTGSIIPTAEYEPINIEGRTFSHTLLDNFNFIEQHNIAIGDRVEVIITGDIIPKISKVIEKGPNKGHFPRPLECPECKAKTEIVGASTKCTNPLCRAVSLAKINNWVKKTGIKYFGTQRQKKCFDANVITNPSELYSNVKKLGEVIGEGNATMVYEQIKSHQNLSLSIFMGSLGIPFLGRSNAQKLIEAGINTLDKFLSFDPDIKIHGFKDNLYEIKNGINQCKPLIEKLLASGVSIIKEPSKMQDKDTKSFCFTGVRLHGDDKAMFEKHGWIEKSSISKNIDYLVAKDLSNNSGKMKKAKELGINVIDINTFMSILKGGL